MRKTSARAGCTPRCAWQRRGGRSLYEFHHDVAGPTMLEVVDALGEAPPRALPGASPQHLPNLAAIARVASLRVVRNHTVGRRPAQSYTSIIWKKEASGRDPAVNAPLR